MLESSVFKRSSPEGAIVSDATYNLIIGLVLCWGLLINWLLVRYLDPALILGIDFRLFLIAYFASCFYGVHLFNKSTDPAISFIGYNLVVIPFGLVVNVVVSRKTVDNAVDSAAALYMDIINLFLRILRILGRRK